MSKSVLIAIPVLLIGGTEMQTLNLADVLISAGYNVTICCYYEYDQGMVERFETAGARVVLMKYERAKGLWHLAKGLMKLFKTIKPDIVHVQYVAPGFIPILAAKLAGIKTVFATVHQPGRVYGLKEKLLLRTAAGFCSAFFCVSRSVEESWFGDSEVFNPDSINNKRRHFTIYNAVDIEKIEKIVKEADSEAITKGFLSKKTPPSPLSLPTGQAGSPSRGEDGSKSAPPLKGGDEGEGDICGFTYGLISKKSLGIDGKKVVGVVGRLRSEKGQAVLLDAMAEVIKTIPDARLLVVGDGPDRMSLELKAKSLGIAGNILWLGQKMPEDVFQLYSVMDVVANPSHFEGFGLTAAEAMAAGLPLVATRVDGLTEVIENDATGLLVSAGDSAALANALTDLLSNRKNAREMGQKGRERVRELFSMEKFRQTILSAYREMV